MYDCFSETVQQQTEKKSSTGLKNGETGELAVVWTSQKFLSFFWVQIFGLGWSLCLGPGLGAGLGLGFPCLALLCIFKKTLSCSRAVLRVTAANLGLVFLISC